MRKLDFKTVALVLQGGGALGSYQAGVVEGLVAAGIEPDWLAGISIGALNTALIAGNPIETRVSKLREFWDTICRPAAFVPPVESLQRWVNGAGPDARKAFSGFEAWRALVAGQRDFFVPRGLHAVARRQAGRHAGELLRHLAIEGHARAIRRFRPHQRRRDAGVGGCGEPAQPATSSTSTTPPGRRARRCAPSTSWRRPRCRRDSRPSRSTASSTGTAVWCRTRRWPPCSRRCRAATRWCSRSTCGARAARCLTTCTTSKSGARTSSTRAARAR